LAKDLLPETRGELGCQGGDLSSNKLVDTHPEFSPEGRRLVLIQNWFEEAELGRFGIQELQRVQSRVRALQEHQRCPIHQIRRNIEWVEIVIRSKERGRLAREGQACGTVGPDLNATEIVRRVTNTLSRATWLVTDPEALAAIAE
jgi:hypothetical protein